MGLSRSQMNSRLEQIIEFAELGNYIDVVIKRYSLGMLSRLGFSVAIHLDPEIILVDEILSVGDYRFQVKSTATLRQFVERGTLVLVSHDLNAIERLCKRAIWLDHGQIKAIGESAEVVHKYIHAQQVLIQPQESETAQPHSNFRVSYQPFDEAFKIFSIETRNEHDEQRSIFSFADTIVVHCHIGVTKPTPNCRILIGLVDTETGVVITAGDNQLAAKPDILHGQSIIECRFPNITLRPRNFGVYIAITNPIALMTLCIWRDLDPRFCIDGLRQAPLLHYWEPQEDRVFTPGVTMTYLETNLPLDSHHDVL